MVLLMRLVGVPDIVDGMAAGRICGGGCEEAASPCELALTFGVRCRQRGRGGAVRSGGHVAERARGWR
jgi:hypothetical protein